MTLLPIVERELRVRSRQALTYWTRGILALVAIFLCLQQLNYAEVFSGAVTAGQVAFRGLAAIAFVICCFGFLITSDAISRERREKTLGLLMLTGIKSGDVLAGKLLSALLILATALLAFVPVLMLPVLAGGVTGAETMLTALALGNTLFFSLAFGLWVSARNLEWFKAFRLALGWVLVWLLGPLVLDRLFRIENMFGLLSPLAAVILAAKNQPMLCGVSVGLGHLIAWVVLVRAGCAMKRAGRDVEPTDSKQTPSPTIPETGSVTQTPGQAPATIAVGHDPLAWLMRRQRGVLGMIWIATVISLISQSSGLLFSLVGGAVPLWLFLWPIMFALSAIVGALIAWAASRFFFEARRSGEFEMLLTTPLGATQIVTAHWAYLRRLLRGPVLLSVVFILIQYAFYGLQRSVISRPLAGLLALVSVAYLVVGLAALCWAAMYFGSRTRSQMLAVGQAVALVKGVPYLLSLVWRMLASWLISSSPTTSSIQVIHWVIPNVIILIFWSVIIARFRRKLLAGNLGTADTGQTPWSPGFLKGKTWRQIRHWTPAS